MNSFSLTGLLVWYAVFLFSATLHEAAHAFAAARGGDFSAYNSGQATLNPLPHIQREKIGMVIVPLLSFILNRGSWMIGWASAPFNPFWAARRPRRALFMALAGPAANLLLVAVSWIAMALGLSLGFFRPGYLSEGFLLVAPTSGSPLAWALAAILDISFQLNVLLLVFNLMPLPPMDGSEIWFLLVKSEEERLRWRELFSSYSLIGLLAAWRLFPWLFQPVFTILIRALSYFA
ncbi:MAG: site-2 protease family protein [Planctomycetota bacterium]|jgi:Zn-dependent protease|nr:site-2 protease family protein [Planctomycetota bacterium]